MQSRRLLNSFIEDLIANSLQPLDDPSIINEYEILNQKCDIIMSRIKKRKEREKNKE